MLGVGEPEPGNGRSQERNPNFADNRLIVLGTNSKLVDELKELRANRSEESVLIDWSPQSGAIKNLVEKISMMQPVEVVDMVIVNSCVPDEITSEREMRKLFSEIRISMKAIAGRGVAEKCFRWWMCVELDGASPSALNIWQASGRLVFRHAAESAKLIGTLVLVGDATRAASDLRDMLDAKNAASSRVVGFGISEQGSVDLVKNNFSISLGQSTRDAGKSAKPDLSLEKNYLIAEIEMAKDSLTDIADELRLTQQNLAASSASLASKRDDIEKVGLEMAVQSHELFAVETDLVAQRGNVAIMSDQADSLRREIEYLLKNHASLTESLVSERAALQIVRDEVTIQVAKAEQIQSALTRAEVDAAHQRTLADDAIRLAEAAHAKLNEIVAETANSREILIEVKNEIENRNQELLRLDAQRAEKAKQTAEYQNSLAERSLVLEAELERLQQLQREVLATLERARAERTAVHEELEKITNLGNDPQIEILRISRDVLTTELAGIEAAKQKAVAEIEASRSAIEGTRQAAAELEAGLATTQRQYEVSRAKVIEIQEKQLDAEQQLYTLEDRLSAFQKERDQLIQFEAELARRSEQLDQIEKNFEAEVSRRIAEQLDQLSAMGARARKKAIKHGSGNEPT